MPDVSVIIPAYGEHDSRHSLAAVTSAWLAQEVPCEVVVATAGEIPVSVADDIDSDRRVRVVRAAPGATAPGLLRNIAASQAHSPWLYLSDADIAPLGRDYLDRALRLAGSGALAQPWMYRLPGGVQALASHAAVDARLQGTGSFCFVAMRPDGRLRPIKGERFVWRDPGRDEDPVKRPMVLAPNTTLDPGNLERHQWRAPYHWGGLLVETRTFWAVAGYCEQYSGWGREDDDLLTKVTARSRVVCGWRAEPSLCCLHFEHSLPYAGSAAERANDSRYVERLMAGAEAMIEADRAAHTTPGGQIPGS
ncbi:glycosyltransferase family 2 protein [Saccharopolyspora phatthalungensis]|uniref:Glycosyltransferase involved in cell wall biosynthesis n=1 Tax=Saccharopolyspora phatthalungensis TaxID=664693 RepID=A0A840QK18_9PSEU|nr:glycosyltransferase family 2 protein [Saccharopolyspora phatthalungensis]MBB5159525.1 glycosyltransferase involved in cell wall biosynthesis [Saccharopolyspora phatthalungensis]